MAYLNFNEFQAATAPAFVPTADIDVTPAPAALSGLEWSVVAMARRDSLASLSTPGRISIALGVVFGGALPNPRLADHRLEALRRIAVLGWHYGYTIPTEELRAFVAAGFTLDQYELVQDSIGRARTARNSGTLQ